MVKGHQRIPGDRDFVLGVFTESGEKADATAVFCFWAAREPGYGLRELGRKLGMTEPGVGYAVNRGERISKLNHYPLRK